MIEPEIAARDLERWAGYLLEHSLGGICAEDRVMVKGERICWPLMEILERKIAEAGATPDVYLIPPNNDRGRVWSATVGRAASGDLAERVPDWHRRRYESMTKYVEVLGAEDPDRYMGLNPDTIKALAAADRTYANIRLSKRWVITLFPTPAFAAMEGMSVEDYTRFIVSASTVDPAPLLEAEQAIEPVFKNGREIKIATVDPHEGRALELRLDISNGRPVLSHGLRNFPDGEIFTSPDARSAEGEIFLDLAVNYGGHDIQGIYLKLAGGRIVEYRAETGHDHLAAIVETDDGSHRLGEVALGMNPGLDRVLKHPLFVEKVGGTLHIAIGASYEDCFAAAPGSEAGRARIDELETTGILNRSAQHVDIVADFRPGGCGRSVRIDDTELVVKNGLWVVA